VTSSDVNHVVSILGRCAATSIEWVSRRGLLFDTATMEAALFMCRGAHRKHLRPKLTARMRVGNGSIQFNTPARCWLGVRMDAPVMFKEHHYQCMKIERAAEVRLRTLTKTYGFIPESVRAVHVVCIHAVAPFGSQLRWNPREVGTRDNLQLLLNRQARSILRVLPTTLHGALMRESWITPAPVILDSRQQ